MKSFNDNDYASHLTKLQKLCLSKNSISKLNLKGLCSLEHLYLDNNRIHNLSILNGLENLVYLNLSNNKIKSIIINIKELFNILILYF